MNTLPRLIVNLTKNNDGILGCDILHDGMEIDATEHIYTHEESSSHPLNKFIGQCVTHNSKFDGCKSGDKFHVHTIKLGVILMAISGDWAMVSTQHGIPYVCPLDELEI